MTEKKVGRPKIEIDFEELKKLCELHCTHDEICHFLDIDYKTLSARIKERGYKDFSTYYKENTEGGKISLRRLQWQAAESGNIRMLIWLGKQVLGQSDKVEQNFKNVTPLPQIVLEINKDLNVSNKKENEN